MTEAVRRAQIVLIPVYRRNWVFTCKETTRTAARAATADERDGGVANRLRGAWTHLGARVSHFPAQVAVRARVACSDL